MAVDEKTHRVRDVSVRTLRAGKGAPLLFLHGAAGLPQWNPFFELLSSKYDVIVPEHPGFGKSEAPSTLRNVADMAMYYLDFIEQFDSDDLHVVGHSLGGWIAAEVAVRSSARLKTLSLLSPAGLRVKGVPMGDNFIWNPEETARNLFHDQSFAERMLAHQPTEEEADIALTNRFMAVRLGWEPRWYNPALINWLHRVKAPTLVLWGDSDKLFPKDYIEPWKNAIPGAKAEIIEQCGHLPHVEKAQVTAQKIMSFVDGASA